MNKKIRTISTLLAVLMLAVAVAVLPAAALPTGETDKTTVGSPSTFTPTAGSAAARGGNITDVTFASVLTATSKWQGYYGNVSGNIFLGTATGDKMFNWAASTAGEVFATQDSSMSIAEWEALTARTATNIDTDFTFTGSDTDSAANTFTVDPSAIVVAGRSIDGGAATAAKTYNSSDIATWTTIALAGSTSAEANYVFAGVISNDGQAYDGSTKDFQMIVPENEATGTETYYFYVELT